MEFSLIGINIIVDGHKVKIPFIDINNIINSINSDNKIFTKIHIKGSYSMYYLIARLKFLAEIIIAMGFESIGISTLIPSSSHRAYDVIYEYIKYFQYLPKLLYNFVDSKKFQSYQNFETGITSIKDGKSYEDIFKFLEIEDEKDRIWLMKLACKYSHIKTTFLNRSTPGTYKYDLFILKKLFNHTKKYVDLFSFCIFAGLSDNDICYINPFKKDIDIISKKDISIDIRYFSKEFANYEDVYANSMVITDKINEFYTKTKIIEYMTRYDLIIKSEKSFIKKFVSPAILSQNFRTNLKEFNILIKYLHEMKFECAIAGGFVSRLMLNTKIPNSSDVDIWFYDSNHENNSKAKQLTVEFIRKTYGESYLLHYPSVITVVIPDHERTIQLVEIKDEESLNDVLNGFDYGYAQSAYNIKTDTFVLTEKMVHTKITGWEFSFNDKTLRPHRIVKGLKLGVSFMITDPFFDMYLQYGYTTKDLLDQFDSEYFSMIKSPRIPSKNENPDRIICEYSKLHEVVCYYTDTEIYRLKRDDIFSESGYAYINQNFSSKFMSSNIHIDTKYICKISEYIKDQIEPNNVDRFEIHRRQKNSIYNYVKINAFKDVEDTEGILFDIYKPVLRELDINNVIIITNVKDTDEIIDENSDKFTSLYTKVIHNYCIRTPCPMILFPNIDAYNEILEILPDRKQNDNDPLTNNTIEDGSKFINIFVNNGSEISILSDNLIDIIITNRINDLNGLFKNFSKIHERNNVFKIVKILFNYIYEQISIEPNNNLLDWIESDYNDPIARSNNVYNGLYECIKDTDYLYNTSKDGEQYLSLSDFLRNILNSFDVYVLIRHFKNINPVDIYQLFINTFLKSFDADIELIETIPEFDDTDALLKWYMPDIEINYENINYPPIEYITIDYDNIPKMEIEYSKETYYKLLVRCSSEVNVYYYKIPFIDISFPKKYITLNIDYDIYENRLINDYEEQMKNYTILIYCPYSKDEQAISDFGYFVTRINLLRNYTNMIGIDIIFNDDEQVIKLKIPNAYAYPIYEPTLTLLRNQYGEYGKHGNDNKEAIDIILQFIKYLGIKNIKHNMIMRRLL